MRATLCILALCHLAGTTAAKATCDLDIKQRLQIKVLGKLPLHAASNAMYPTLPTKTTFSAVPYSPTETKLRRGDIVAFCLPKDLGVIFIKRLIGLPGDRVRIADNQIVLNGRPVARTPDSKGNLADSRGFSCFEETLNEQSYRVCQTDPASSTLSNFGETTVAPGELFVLGDNRDISLDSRIPQQFGPVLIDNLIGVVKREP